MAKESWQLLVPQPSHFLLQQNHFECDERTFNLLSWLEAEGTTFPHLEVGTGKCVVTGYVSVKPALRRQNVYKLQAQRIERDKKLRKVTITGIVLGSVFCDCVVLGVTDFVGVL